MIALPITRSKFVLALAHTQTSYSKKITGRPTKQSQYSIYIYTVSTSLYFTYIRRSLSDQCRALKIHCSITCSQWDIRMASVGEGAKDREASVKGPKTASLRMDRNSNTYRSLISIGDCIKNLKIERPKGYKQRVRDYSHIPHGNFSSIIDRFFRFTSMYTHTTLSSI